MERESIAELVIISGIVVALVGQLWFNRNEKPPQIHEPRYEDVNGDGIKDMVGEELITINGIFGYKSYRIREKVFYGHRTPNERIEYSEY